MQIITLVFAGVPGLTEYLRNGHFLSENIIQQRLGRLESSQIFKEMIDRSVEFVGVPAGGVGGDEAIRGDPERVAGGKRLGVGHVEVGGGEMFFRQRFDQGRLIDG